MSKTYQQLQNEIETLQRRAEAQRQKELAAVVKELKDAIAYWELTAADLGLDGSAPKKRAAKKAATAGRRAAKKAAGKRAAAPAAAKYRDDAGNTWGGRGPRPGWVKAALEAGKSLEDLQA